MPLKLTGNCFFHGSLSPLMSCIFVFVFCRCCNNILHLLPHSLKPKCPAGPAACCAPGWAELKSRTQLARLVRGCSREASSPQTFGLSGGLSPCGCKTDAPCPCWWLAQVRSAAGSTCLPGHVAPPPPILQRGVESSLHLKSFWPSLLLPAGERSLL